MKNFITVTCQELKHSLTQIKSLHQEFDLAFKETQNKHHEVQPRDVGGKKEMKEKLDKAHALMQALESAISNLREKLTPKKIQVIYTHPDKDRSQETITLNIEENLKTFTNLYESKDIDLPQDFESQVKQIWKDNIKEIQQEIQENGFNYILILPATQDLEALSEKLKIRNGYWLSDNFKEEGGFNGSISQNTNQIRIILAHDAKELKDRPELEQTLGIKGEAVDLARSLTLDAYLVFQSIYHQKTGKHLDENYWTWIATMSGDRLVGSSWHPDGGKLGVCANDLENGRGHLGVRPARCFF